MEAIAEQLPGEVREWLSTLKDYELINIFTNAYINMTTRGDPPGVSSDCKIIQQSAIIGAEGEEQIESILKERYNIDNTAKKGKCGDFVIMKDNNRVMVEVKKYSKTVPSNEIEKFFRDVNANNSIKGAVMISLTSKIIGKRQVEYNNRNTNGNNIPIVFISLMDIPLNISKICIQSIIDVLYSEISSNDRYIDISDNITNAIYDIIRNVDYISQARLIVNETQSMMNKQFNKLIQSILMAEVNIQKSIESVQSSIEIVDIEKSSIENAIDNISHKIDSSKRNLLTKLLCGKNVLLCKDVILTDDKTVSVKVNKRNITVSINRDLKETIRVNGKWSHSNKKLTVELTENTLCDILQFIK